MDKEGTRDWLLEQEHDGATTCILLGRMQDEDKGRLKRYQNVLWFVDSDGSKLLKHTPQTLKLGLLELLSPEDVDETIEDFLLINTFSIPDVLCANAIMERDTNAYNFLLSRIHMICEATLRARSTRQEEGFVLQANILENLHHYISSRISDS